MGDKRMKNIYQKLHQACLNAGGVKKGEKVNPTLNQKQLRTQQGGFNKNHPTI